MIKSGVYQIILNDDGRSYIGSAINIQSRWQNHRILSRSTGTKQVIAKALAKYGIENFEWKVLEYCPTNILIAREQYWLDTIRPFIDENNGWNVRKVADSNLGIARSTESRKKQSAATIGVPKTDEHKRNMSIAWHSAHGEHYLAQLSARMTGDKNIACRPDVKEKISAAMIGRTWKHDLARVVQHKLSHTGLKRSAEQRAKMREAQQKNKTRSDEAKEKFYLAQRVLYEVTDRSGKQFQIYSRELKVYCADNNLGYSNLITAAKTKKKYKGYSVRRLS